MLHYYTRHTPHESFQSVRTPADGVWVHMTDPSPSELRELAAGYNLDIHVVQNVADKNELSRSEYRDGIQYVFMRPAIQTGQGEVVTSPFLMIVTPSNFITIASTDALTAHNIMSAGADAPLRASDRVAMLLLVMHTIISGYELNIQHADRYIKGIRRKLQNHEVSNRDFVHFVTLEDNLNQYQFSLQDSLALIERMKDNDHTLLDRAQLEQLHDMELYVKQLLSAVATHAKTVDSIQTVYSTIANNTLNQRMKALTILTVLIALPNVFYGMYGMNVLLPFQDASWAFPVIVVFTLCLIIAVYAIAKRFRLF